jgi:adenosylcobinamide kinase/adenosylcobinamide-phosphate guanylyltransferase
MLTLVIGGAGSGKSAFAESLTLRLPGKRIYLAAMLARDGESVRRVERHRAQRRGKGFETLERYTDVDMLILPQGGGTALLECVCNLTANEMYIHPEKPVDPVEKVMAGIENLARQTDRLIVITNDVGSDDGQYPQETRRYIRALGEINARVAQMADRVYELVAGIPLCLKGDRV